MPLIQPSLQFQAANPQTVASEVGGTLEHWFDASQSAKLTSSQLRDVRDVNSPSSPTYPYLAPFGAGSFSAAGSYLSLAGSATSVPVLKTTGGTNTGLTNYTSQTTAGRSILICGVFYSTDDAGVNVAGRTFFSQNASDGLASRFFQVYRYPKANSLNQRTTQIISRGVDTAIYEDSTLTLSQPFLIMVYQTIGATSNTTLSITRPPILFPLAASGTYNSANESGANFLIGARMGASSAIAAISLMNGGFGELVVISKASSMSQFEDPSSSSLATRARNYFISKWSLAENIRANY